LVHNGTVTEHEEPGDPAGLTLSDNLARAVASLRKQRRLPMTELEALLRAIGMPIPRQGLMRLEAGKRKVDLEEVVALAQVFNVPPLLLLFPVGHAAETELRAGDEAGTAPALRMDPWTAAKWFMGEASLDGGPLPAEAADIRRFREHDRALTEAEGARADVELERGGPKEQEAERAWRVALRDLRTIRATIRQRGLTPPALPDFLEEVDDEQYRFVESPASGGVPLLMERVDGRDRPVTFNERA
jgi:hypothetical protein